MDKTKDQQKKLFQELLMPELGALFRTALRTVSYTHLSNWIPGKSQ